MALVAHSSIDKLHDSSSVARPDLRQFPKAIAHRGYSAKYPENSMPAFTAAVNTGAHALETDVHLSKDDVVVLSHDPTLKRCFGENGKIIDYDWSYLSKLKCLREPHVGMPRLLDLLEYMASPGLDDIWVLLDIKADNNLDKIMSLIARTLRDAPSSSIPWTKRVVLGCWAVEYLPFCNKYLPDFPITHIGFDLFYARQFLDVPKVNFNMLQQILVGPTGHRFLRDTRAAGRSVHVWTVNEPSMMRWSIHKQVDGVVTDNPAEYFRVCEEYDGKEDALTFRACLNIVGVNLLCKIFGSLFRWRYGFRGPLTFRRSVLDLVWSSK